MTKLKITLALAASLLCNVLWGQDKQLKKVSNDKLPYAEIPMHAEAYTAGSVAARLIDGLGFRFYWATEGLRSEDLTFKPDNDARTTSETIAHIYEMSEMIKNATTLTINVPNQSPAVPFHVMRKKTLENLKIASDKLMNSSDEELAMYTLKYKQGDKLLEYPFWNNINGPICDCLWHTGQIVSFRRLSGNPFSKKVNLLTGTVTK